MGYPPQKSQHSRRWKIPGAGRRHLTLGILPVPCRLPVSQSILDVMPLILVVKEYIKSPTFSVKWSKKNIGNCSIPSYSHYSLGWITIVSIFYEDPRYIPCFESTSHTKMDAWLHLGRSAGRLRCLQRPHQTSLNQVHIKSTISTYIVALFT